MKVTGDAHDVQVTVGQHVPSLVLIFEAEATPLLLGNPDPDVMGRILATLSEPWRELLLAAIEHQWPESTE